MLSVYLCKYLKNAIHCAFCLVLINLLVVINKYSVTVYYFGSNLDFTRGICPEMAG